MVAPARGARERGTRAVEMMKMEPVTRRRAARATTAETEPPNGAVKRLGRATQRMFERASARSTNCHFGPWRLVAARGFRM